MTGALESFSTTFMVSTETWARSTIMPRRFISASTVCGDRDRAGEGCARHHGSPAWGDTMYPGHLLLSVTTRRGAGGCQYHNPQPEPLLPGATIDTVPTHLPKGREAVMLGLLVLGVHQPVVSPAEWGDHQGRPPWQVPPLSHTPRPPPCSPCHPIPVPVPPMGCYQGVLQLWVRVM